MQPPLHLGVSLPSYTPTARTQSVIVKIKNDVQSNYLYLDDVYHENYLSNNNLSSPINQQNNEYKCNWLNCDRFFHNLECLASHVTQVHATNSLSDGLFYCHWSGCQRSLPFNARYKMLVHIRTHTKEKPHQCHLCQKRFSRAENLKIHIRSHSGEKPYVCMYEGCNKAYSNSSDRFKHTRTHTMEKPYMCKMPGCQKRYTDPSSLRKHIKTTKHLKPSKPSENQNDVVREKTQQQQQHDKFCKSMKEMCNINGNKRDIYWCNREAGCDSILNCRNHNLKGEQIFAINLDITGGDKPLDLRLNRS